MRKPRRLGDFGETPTLSRVRRIAAGGMGYVDLATMKRGAFERYVAIKRIHRHLLEDDEQRKMFMDEAQLAGLIRHPNVVSVVDVFEDEDGPALVMDYVEGVSLARILETQALPVQLALKFCLDVARGLDAAHSLRDISGKLLSLVHRDVTPSNVLIGLDGVARLTDFGVAKALNRQAQTHTGTLKGKLGYMAPELLRFEAPSAKSDLFSLGVVLFECLSGERLYPSGETADGPRRILTEPPPDIADFRRNVPVAIVQLLFKMLAKYPKERPESAADVAWTLQLAIDEVSATEGHYDPVSFTRSVLNALGSDELQVTGHSGGPPPTRRLWPIVLLGSFVVARAGILWFSTAPEDAPPEQPATPIPITVDAAPPARVESEAAVTEPTRARERSKTRKRKRRVIESNEARKKYPTWDWEGE
ncbi:MAG: serine/threonine-protein kinase [Myxococcota bacterium]